MVRLFFNIILLLLATAWTLALMFPNKILYGCGRVKQVLPSMAFNLPPPQYDANGMLTTFRNHHSNIFVWYFHGNGVKAENTWWHMGRLFGICNCTIRVVEYPMCDETTLVVGASLEDAIDRTIYLFINHLNKQGQNFVLATSLGTNIFLRSYKKMWKKDKDAIHGIILENPLTDVYEILWYHLKFPFANPFSAPELPILDKPVLILTSEADEIVPTYMSTQIFYMAPAWCRKQVVLHGALHGHAGAHPDYLPAIEEFISVWSRIKL